jgi:alkylation response protein AidB-like acyl-CoA dehydrogenase
MDFTLSPELQALQQRTRDFIREQVVPLESAAPRDPHGPSETLRRELVDRARRAGLLTPHASRELGGLGLSHVEKAIVFEEPKDAIAGTAKIQASPMAQIAGWREVATILAPTLLGDAQQTLLAEE